MRLTALTSLRFGSKNGGVVDVLEGEDFEGDKSLVDEGLAAQAKPETKAETKAEAKARHDADAKAKADADAKAKADADAKAKADADAAAGGASTTPAP